MRYCNISNCDREVGNHGAKGMCSMHYKRIGLGKPLDDPVKERVWHGMCGTPTYRSYRAMIVRCYKPYTQNYERYGRRGIRVCDEWFNSFVAFYRDMGKRPEGMSLDRIDNNGNYNKDNCKWSTLSEQSQNTRLHKTNKSGVHGVYFDKNRSRWFAQITAKINIIT